MIHFPEIKMVYEGYLFEELGFKIEKFEVSTGSGLMAIILN